MIGYVLCGLFFVVLGFVAGWACDWFFGDNDNEDEDDVPEPYLLDSSKLSDYEKECLKNSLQATDVSMIEIADAIRNSGRPYYVDADLVKGASDEQIQRDFDDDGCFIFNDSWLISEEQVEQYDDYPVP